ncbi:MAG TPA: hypothetical protein VN426_10995 [Syntrophomonadaceae bacterium]|nr:hypothetical protein [Syntrophomonadaceae bacterium]
MKKAIVYMTLTLLLTLALNIPVSAASQESGSEPNVNEQQQLRYTYISAMGSGLSIEGGYATCLGYVTLLENYDSSITITLQRSTNGSSWSNVKAWSGSFSGSGAHSIEKGYYVYSGYIYRVMTSVKIKSGSTVIETATCYSPQKSY